jgi:PAS domain S-box-containing protein
MVNNNNRDGIIWLAWNKGKQLKELGAGDMVEKAGDLVKRETEGSQQSPGGNISSENRMQEPRIIIKALQDELRECKDYIKQLKLREAQYYDILDNMSETVERDSPDYRLNYVNNAFCEYYGVKREDVLGMDTMDYIVEEDRQPIDDLMKTITPENPVYHYQCRVKKAGGQIAWIECFGRCFFDQKGRVVEYQDVSRDITHYKETQDELEEKVRKRTKELSKANQELRGLNSYLQSILKNISEGVIVVNEEGEVELLNFGLNKNWESNASDIKEKIQRDILDNKKSVLYRMLQERKNFQSQEMIFPSKKGDIYCFASGVYLETPKGEVKQGVIVLNPITEVRRLVNRFSGSQARFRFRDIVTNSLTMQEMIRLARQAAMSNGNIIIEGESGTGKEMFAQAIHNSSNRNQGPFVAVNCGAIPRELVGSELFGYMEGAFTGAKKGGKPGKFELASGGTIFLDEIGDMPLEQQITLLRVVQERTITRIGGNRLIPVDVRIICATNKNLFHEVTQGNFRKDLYYRLNVINLHIPPLRERREDILLLFNYFLHKLDKSGFHSFNTVEPAVLEFLLKYDWPGNVRELQNVTERIIYLAAQDPISLQYLPHNIFSYKSTISETAGKPETKRTQSIVEFRKQKKKEKDALEGERIYLAP